MLIAKIRTELLGVINKYSMKNECNKKEKDFLLSKTKGFTIPHFYIIWKILKNPVIGRPIVAGYDWIFREKKGSTWLQVILLSYGLFPTESE